MRRFMRYLLAQGKRALRLLPRTLAVTLLLTLAASVAGAAISVRRASDASRQRVPVGVVADEANPYIIMGIHALETFDAARDEFEFLIMEEPEALAQLRAGKLRAYLVIPDDFLEAMYTDDVHPIRFITPDGAPGLETRLAAELAGAVARLMTETQNAQYGAIHYVMDHPSDMNPYLADDELINRYFTLVLGRDKLLRLETVGVSGTLGYAAYYLCGFTVALALLWGIGASPLFSRRSDELGLLLRARGFGAARQIAGEFGAYYALTLLGALCAGTAAVLLLRRFSANIPELRYLSPFSLFPALALTVLALGAMQFFLYELAPENPNGILLQFLNAAAQGYAAGCFYPRSFFPEGLRTLGGCLPAGAALRYLGGAVSGSGGGGLAMLGWTAVFLALAAALRHRRLTG